MRKPGRAATAAARIFTAALLFAGASQAQVQRTFVNLGFELPGAAPSTCFFQVGESAVPGWTTNHPSANGTACAPNIAQTPGPLIEIWTNGFSSVPARFGNQFAELNAEAASRIFQNVCLANGEPIGWRFSHRGRQSATTSDVMEFRVGSTAGTNRVIRAATQNDGGIDAPTCYGTSGADGSVSANTCSDAAATGGWHDYSGQFTWTGATGVQAIGFEAISAAGGTTIGNFLDDIQVTLRPFVELTSATVAAREGTSDALPALRVVGTVPAGGISVQLAINGGTAQRGVDYTTATGTDTISVTVPAGVYDGTNFPLPMALVDDAAIEDNETITLAITSSPTNYVLSSTQTCGGVPITATTVTIADNDIDLRAALTSSVASARAGDSIGYTLTVTNNTAKPTTGDATSHDTVAPVSAAPATGLAFTTWACTATGGARCPGGTVNGTTSGNGAITGDATLPAGNGAAGGSVSYAITAAIDPAHCTALTQTASVATPVPFAEGTSVQAGFVSPAPGGSVDNATSANVAVRCNSAPVAQAAAMSTGTGSVAIVLHATDADSDPLTYRVTTPPAHGTLSGTAPTLTYTPNAGYVGDDTFAFVANDGTTDSAPATITVSISGVNHPPVITSTPLTHVSEGSPHADLAVAEDPDAGDTQTWRLPSAPGTLAINATTGALAGVLDTPVQSVRTQNTQCYVKRLSCPGSTPAISGEWRLPRTDNLTMQMGLDFAGYYQLADFGNLASLPGRYGGLVAEPDRCDRLLVGGTANLAGGALYAVDVARDDEGHIVALGETVRRVADAPFNDGGMLFAPNGTMLLAGWPINKLHQIRPGQSTLSKVIDLAPLNVATSLAALGYYPPDRPQDGRMKFLSWSTGEWYDAQITDDGTGNGTFNVAVTTPHIRKLTGGPEGFVYVAGDTPGFTKPTLLVSEWSSGRVVTYDIDANGDPTTSTWRQFITNLTGAEGGFIDPTTGDFWFTTFGGGDRLIRVTGFQPPVYKAPDLAAFDLALDGGTLRFNVVNRGIADAPASHATAYVRQPDGSLLPLGGIDVGVLAANASQALSLAVTGLPEGADIIVDVDDRSQVRECDEDNNDNAAAHVAATVTDRAGASDRLDWLVNVDDINVAPQITTTGIPEATAGRNYFTHVEAHDTDRGDGLTYSLDAPPAGVTIGAFTGNVRWAPPTGRTTPLAIRVRVTDLRGLSATRDYTIGMRAAPNRAPYFLTSGPPTVIAGGIYRYQAEGSDPDGDTLTYRLDFRPEGMTINPATGAIYWPVPANLRGTVRAVVEVSDPSGAVGRQTISTLVLAPGPNRAPTITSLPPTAAQIGTAYRYDLNASDADGDTLTYRLTQAPDGMTIDAGTGLVEWTPAATGRVTVVAQATDAALAAEQRWTIDVGTSAIVFDATVTVQPDPVVPGGSISVSIGTVGATGPVSVTATLDTAPVTLTPNGTTTLTAPTAPGVHVLVVNAGDGTHTDTTSTPFAVSDPADANPPQVALASPLDGSEITMPVAVRGTVNDASLRDWRLYLRPANSPGATPELLASGTGNVADAVIAQFDPTLRMNDQYVLILQATDTSGRVSVDSAVVRVTGEMKVGHFAITLEDVNIPVAGIPIRVTRTYDTRQRGESLDFGYGWSVDYQNVRIRESQAPGFAWQLQETGSGINRRFCVVAAGSRTVTVTLPDGDVETFVAKASPECTNLVPTTDVQLVFDPVGDTHSTLEQTDFGTLRVVTVAGEPRSNLVDPDSPTTPADPSHYRLTTREGLKYELDQGFGIRQVKDLAGNTLTYSAAGIAHSSGIGVDFVRDPATGRIREILLPDGKKITYAYDAAGDLRTSTDAALQSTSYTYLARLPHYLEDLTDARGRRVQRNEYDDDGRLTATIDADGKRIVFTHDITGRTEQVRDRRGNQATYVYDDEGRVLSETNALGETTLRTYDADGNELTRTDALGHVTTWTYNAYGNQLTEKNPLGETTRTEYDTRNNVTQQFQPDGRKMADNTFDPAWGDLRSTTDALGQSTTFTYDHENGLNTGELLGMTDATGAVTQYDVNAKGWQRGQTDALGRSVTHTHDASGRVKTETALRTDVNGATTTTATMVTAYVYDDKGRLTLTTHPDGTVTSTTYNAIDQPETECDALNRCTRHRYDARGNLDLTTYPDGTTEAKTYDENGNVLAETDREGRTTRTIYDAANRVTTTVYPDSTPNDGSDNPFTTNTYDDAGRLTATSDENGRTTTYGYDNADRRTTVTNALGETTTTVYDVNGRRAQMIDAASRITRFVYDNAGRLVETIHPDAATDDGDDANNPRTTTGYDAAGRKVTDTDEAGRITRYAYDKLGRLIAVFLPNPATGANPAVSGNPPASPDTGVLVTRYAYDERGNKTTQTDARGKVTRWRYDNAGRVISRVLPMAQVETFVYDPQGRRTTFTDFRGVVAKYTYHPNTDLVATIDYPTKADVNFAYTPGGQLREVNDENGTTRYERDARNRLTQVTWPVRLKETVAQTIRYAYDAAGNRTQLKTANQTLDYTYDVLNRLATVKAAAEAQPMATYAYDAVGNRQSVSLVNGTRTDYTYDRRNRLARIDHKLGTAPLLSVSYTLDASGLRTGIDETGTANRQVAYSYDAVKRLTKESVISTAGDRRTTWTYDKVGNRLTQVKERGPIGALTGTASTTSTYDDNDRLNEEITTLTGAMPGITAGRSGYTYDAAGNLTYRFGAAGEANYLFDDANRMYYTAPTPSGVMRYAYNHDGIRISQTTNATGSAIVTNYLVDPNQPYAQVIEEAQQRTNTVPKLTAMYAIGDDRIRQFRPAQIADSVTPASPAMTRYYHADGLGSTRLLSDQAGATTDRYAYEAFGEIDTAQTLQATSNEFMYTGEQRDPNLGFYYLRARYMNPANGRFTQLDPYQGNAQRPLTLNKYTYVENGPISKVDPTGRMSIQSVATAGIVAGVLATAALHASRTAVSDNHPVGGFDPIGVGWLMIQAMSGPAVQPLVRALARTRQDTTVDLFRAVEDAEMLDIWACNCFRPGPSDFVKQFFGQLEQARQIGDRFKSFYGVPSYHLIRATISRTLFDALDHAAYEPGIGPIITVQHGLLPAFNGEVQEHGGVHYIGEY